MTQLKQPFSYFDFKKIYSKVPRLCVDLIIHDKKGILLTKRMLKSWKGQWHFPGGTVFYKEKAIDAVKRVAREEVHVEVEVDRFLTFIEYESEERERGYGWTVSLAFLCHIIHGIPSSSNQGADPRFFTVIPEKMVIEQKEFLGVFLNEILNRYGE